eukprot:m.3017 g.3017  ORF g.3017 m.3017 type:complete len:96 (-) comp2643_c0_seq2:2412-2699(-)
MASTEDKPAEEKFQEDHVNDGDEDEDEEDVVDPREAIKENCEASSGCAALATKLEECNARVNSKSNTEETCLEELQDFVVCVDHCIAHDLFKHLK